MSIPLDPRLQRLVDIEAVKHLKARYCEACDDDHNPERVAALFVADGVWEGANIGVHARGHEAIKAYFSGIRTSGRIRNSAHMVFNPIIEPAGDRATGRWRLLMQYTARLANDAVEYQRIIGRYEDSYVRVNDQWLFERLCVTVEEAGPYDARDSGLRR